MRTAAKKKPLKGSASSVSAADLVARLLEDESARQVLASLALDRSGSDKLGEAAELAALRHELADSRRKLADLEQRFSELATSSRTLLRLASRPF
ncbi:hypothetical protein [Nannocystis pusilla]|uniref:hypothetical protein n=1 Tax=Nannocystis pusilla TaxID=889268 RepID=UPI003B7B2913